MFFGEKKSFELFVKKMIENGGSFFLSQNSKMVILLVRKIEHQVHGCRFQTLEISNFRYFDPGVFRQFLPYFQHMIFR